MKGKAGVPIWMEVEREAGPLLVNLMMVMMAYPDPTGGTVLVFASGDRTLVPSLPYSALLSYVRGVQ